jgi:hypothetical protein
VEFIVDENNKSFTPSRRRRSLRKHLADLAWRDSMERTDTWHKSIEINPVTLDVLPVENFLWQFCTGFVKEESAVHATVGRT